MVRKTHPNSGLDLEDIIKENSPKLHSYVMSKVGNRDDADDIVQDTLYQFLRAVSIIDNPIEKVTSWLYKVAHNIIINHGKKHRKDDDYMQDVSEILMASDSESPEMKMLRRMVWDELDNALTELPSEQREAILLTEIQGMSVKEAALRMGVSQNTFLSRKHYAKVTKRFRRF